MGSAMSFADTHKWCSVDQSSGHIAVIAVHVDGGSVLQVHPHGLRHIRSDKRVNEWRAPGRRTITKAATNERQVVIALSGGECIYFEQDTMGQLVETEKKEMSGDVACLDVGPVPEGRQRSRFLAVGSYDNTVSDNTGWHYGICL